MIEEGLKTFLEAQTAITNLVGSRIYPLILPQKPAYPALTYARVSGLRLHNFGGVAGRGWPRFTVSLWAETYAAAKALAEKTRQALDGHRGALGSAAGVAVSIENEIDFYEGEAKVYRVLQDYFISHLET